MNAVWAWARLDLRRRWRSLVVLTVLVAIGSGTVMAAVAGARRADSSLDRLLERTLPADVEIAPSRPDFDWAPIRELPYVESLATWILSWPVVDGVEAESILYPPLGPGLLADIEKPVLLAGRNVRPDSATEVVVTRRFTELHDKGVGDELTMRLPTPEQLNESDGSVPPESYEGPVATLTIVGVARAPWLELGAPKGRLIFSPGMSAKYGPNIQGWFAPVNAVARLRGGAADIPRLRADLKQVTGMGDIQVVDLRDRYEREQDAIAFENAWLYAFAAAACVAALVIVGQGIARHASLAATELRVARALGMAPRQRMVAAVLGPSGAGAAGALLGAGLALAASPMFPLGTAKELNPEPGLFADVMVLGVGAAATLATVTGIACAAALLTERNRARAPRRSRSVAGAIRVGMPVPVVTGMQFALERGGGRTGAPVVSVISATCAGVIGVVASVCVLAGLDDVESHAERLGQRWQMDTPVGFNGFDIVPVDAVREAIGSLPDVAAVDEVTLQSATTDDGAASLMMWATDADLPRVLLAGRLPGSADELALAPRSARALDVGVGDTVHLTGSGKDATYAVTGIALAGTSLQTHYDEGAWITMSGRDRLFDHWGLRMLMTTVKPGTPAAGLGERLRGQLSTASPDLAPILMGAGFSPYAETNAGVGPDIDRLAAMRSLPLALGGFLAVLAIGALSHALAVTTRRRQLHIATLRALGGTPGQSRLVVAAQALTVATVAIVVGLPLGVAAGRTLWRYVASYAPVDFVAPSVTGPVAGIALAVPAIAIVLAVFPAWRASRIPVAATLRTE